MMDPVTRLEWAIDHVRQCSFPTFHDLLDYEQVLIAMQEALAEIKTLRADVVIANQMGGFREIKRIIVGSA